MGVSRRSFEIQLSVYKWNLEFQEIASFFRAPSEFQPQRPLKVWLRACWLDWTIQKSQSPVNLGSPAKVHHRLASSSLVSSRPVSDHRPPAPGSS